MAYSAGGPGGDHVARVERDDGGDVGDQEFGGEDEVAGGGALLDFAVDCGGHEGACRELVFGDQGRTERSGVLPRLTLEPLDGAELVVAHADVVQDRVTGDVVFRVGLGDAAALLADDHGEFGFPVNGVRFLRQRQVIVRADQGFLVLREQGGVLGDFPAHFLDVVAVVVADADDLPRCGYNGGEVGAVERVRWAVGRLRFLFPSGVAQQRADVGETGNLDEGFAVLADGHGAISGSG